MGRTKKIARISTNWAHARIPCKQPTIRVRVIPKSPIAKSNTRSNSAPAHVSPNVFDDPEYEEDDFDFGSPTMPRSPAHVSLIVSEDSESEEANFDDVGSPIIPRAPAHVSPNVSEDSEPEEVDIDDVDDVGSPTMPRAPAHVSPNVSQDSESEEDDIDDVGSPTMPSAPAHESPNVSEDSEPEEANFDDVGSPTMATGGSDSRSNSGHQNTHVPNAPSCSFVSCETVKYSQGFILKFLHVEGVGESELPLSAEDVRKLRGACERSPFGQCWEIDASKVTFPVAPQFLSGKIQLLVMNALRDLGQEFTGVQVEARFRNIFLCETDDDDGHFKFHHEDIPRKENLGLFATFLLQIPTEDGYKGGNFVVQHRNAMKALDCHMVSSIGFCYTIFLAECRVEELQKLTFGTRVCLTLDLLVKKQDDDDASQQAQRQKQNLVRRFIYLSSDSDEDD